MNAIQPIRGQESLYKLYNMSYCNFGSFVREQRKFSSPCIHPGIQEINKTNIKKQTNKQTDRQTDRPTDRQIDRQTDNQTTKQKIRQADRKQTNKQKTAINVEKYCFVRVMKKIECTYQRSQLPWHVQ